MFQSLHWMALLVALGLASNAGALPLISEVLYDASGSDNGAVFVEIYGMAGTRLDGFRLEGVNGSNGSVGPVVWLAGSIPSNGFFVVADDRGDGQSDVPPIRPQVLEKPPHQAGIVPLSERLFFLEAVLRWRHFVLPSVGG